MENENSQGKSKNQIRFSEMVAGVSFLILLGAVLVYYVYEIITM
jgi:hypothetical protein